METILTSEIIEIIPRQRTCRSANCTKHKLTDVQNPTTPTSNLKEEEESEKSTKNEEPQLLTNVHIATTATSNLTEEQESDKGTKNEEPQLLTNVHNLTTPTSNVTEEQESDKGTKNKEPQLLTNVHNLTTPTSNVTEEQESDKGTKNEESQLLTNVHNSTTATCNLTEEQESDKGTKNEESQLLTNVHNSTTATCNLTEEQESNKGTKNEEPQLLTDVHNSKTPTSNLTEEQESNKGTKNEEPQLFTDVHNSTATTSNLTEEQELDKLYGAYYKQISAPRIERILARMHGKWCETDGCVHIVRKCGNMSFFGETRNGNLCLENFEALYLLELGRMQLEYNNMLVSIEQAYLLLLGESASQAYCDYLMYSNLTRSGYILLKYRNVQYNDQTEPSHDSCVWALLLHEVMNKPIPPCIEKSPLYETVKEDATRIKALMIEQTQEETKEVSNEININVKLNLSEEARVESKVWANKPRLVKCGTSSSFADILTSETEYEKFRSIFESFDVVHLQPEETKAETNPAPCTDNFRELHISFDAYLHNGGFKRRTTQPPHFRLVVLDQSQPFPSHAEIRKCYKQQLHAVPLLVTSIGESKQLQAYLYYFT